MSRTPHWRTLDIGELNDVLARAKAVLDEPDHQTLRLSVDGFVELLRLLEDKRMTIQRLRQMLFGARTEKTSEVLRDAHDEATSRPGVNAPHETGKGKSKGHGRHPAAAYTGADTVPVSHPVLASGQACPHCHHGKIYQQREPGVLVRIVGQAPLGATCYTLEKLRCNLCGELFTAPAPEAAGGEKYNETAASMIAVLKYGSGFPFHRLARLQAHLGVPVPPSTQWDIVERAARKLLPVHHELIRQAAQGHVVHNDDTTMKILQLMDPQRRHEAFNDSPPGRSGVFTSGIVSLHQQRTIALFFTGGNHAGENLEQVLLHRASQLSPPIQMCDALSRNTSPEFETIVANCIAHGRRKFVELVNNFPDQCREVLEALRDVYKTDAVANKNRLSPEQRLTFHQAESGPLMEGLHNWMTQQLEDHNVEPNSGLGAAIGYMLNHWDKLTLFLRVPGAPLDNNICERALKKAILHRKSALFYKTLNGARVGDLFMSLIYTSELAGVDPCDYLTALQKHARNLSLRAHDWMPWNYRDALARASPP